MATNDDLGHTPASIAKKLHSGVVQGKTDPNAPKGQLHGVREKNVSGKDGSSISFQAGPHDPGVVKPSGSGGLKRK